MPIDRLYKTLITIPAAQIGSGGVSGFSAKLTTPCFAACPELVTLGSPYALQAGAGDLLIYDSTGTLRYAVDVIRFTLSATWTDSVVEISFGQLSLSSVVDGTFWLYSGHASPQSQPAAGASYGQYAVYETAKVGYWPLSDGSGLTAADRTSNQNNGTLTNGPTWTGAGKVGTGLSFDGTDDYISTVDGPFNFGITSFSASIWLKTSTVNRAFMGHYAPNPVNRGWGMYVFPNSGPYIGLDLYANGDGGSVDNAYGSDSILADDAWHHVTGVWTRNGNSVTIEGFKDGVSVGSFAGISGNISASATFEIGTYGSNTPGFLGLLDDVRIYNRALVQADITTVYNSTNSPASFCVLGARQSNVTGSPATYRRRAASRYGISL